jgi:hypothetical protein
MLVVLPLFCEGCVVCGENLASRVMMWFSVPPHVVLLCFAPLEVKLLFAPLEVHHFLPFRRGGITTLDLCRVAPLNISAKRFNASVCSSPTLQNGPAGCGCNSAWVSSVAAFVASSCVEGNGNLKFSGKIQLFLQRALPWCW